MSKKKIKKSYNGIFYVAISLVACLGVGAFALAYSVGQTNNTTVNTDGGSYIVNNEIAEQAPDEFNLGAQPGTDLTVDNLTYGSSRSKGLTFKEGATSTPGGLFVLDNYGPTKVCSRVELDISTASTVGGVLGTGLPLVFSVSTSTIGTLNATASLIATSTLATSTVQLFDTTANAGTYATAGTDDGKSWLWEQGDSIIGQYDILTGSDATSTSYGMAGSVYVNCHERN